MARRQIKQDDDTVKIVEQDFLRETLKITARATYCFFTMVLLSTMTCHSTVIRVPQDQSSIQSAITSSRDGDTVLVSPGTYVENLDLLVKNITVASLFLITGDRQYIDQTTIRGDSTMPNSVVTIAGGQSLSTVVCGFTITGGHGQKVDDFYMGGGILIRDSSPLISGNLITLNVVSTSCAARGGGIAIKGSANPHVSGNTILFNSVNGLCDCICYFGGGIWIDSTSNPLIGGGQSGGNNIYSNFADLGGLVFREGKGDVVNVQYNYWGGGAPDSFAVFPYNQFDVSHWLSSPLAVREVEKPHLSTQFLLQQNFPNPFNPTTTIRFYLFQSGRIDLSVFNVLGDRVATLVTGTLSAGHHELTWDPRDLPTGVYHYRLQSELHSETKKLLLMK